MDSNFYFYQEVIVKYKIDKLLKPKNLGNGALDNVTLSDLYKALELCYAEINHSFTDYNFIHDSMIHKEWKY